MVALSPLNVFLVPHCKGLREHVFSVFIPFPSGEHPRIGALDVCPFVPVSNVTMEDCVELSRQFAQQLAQSSGAIAQVQC